MAGTALAHRGALTGELLTAARRGDRRAVAALMARFRPLVVQVARRYFASGLEREDLVQEGLIGLYTAILSFRPERAVPFERLASVLVRRRLASTVRAASRQKTLPLASYVALEEGTVAAFCPRMRAVEAQAGYEQAVAPLLDRLSAFEGEVLEGLFRGHDPAELAAALGCSQKAIANAIARIREKVRQLGDRSLFAC